MKPVAAFFFLMLAGQVSAAEVDAVTVSHEGGRYRIQMQARLNAKPAVAFATFSRYEQLPRINNAIEAVQRRKDAPSGTTRLYTKVRVCVAFFCKRLEQVQDMRATHKAGTYELEAQVLPALSDLKFGHARWKMAPCGKGTCLDFKAELEPDFWVPPLIGPWLIQRKMRQEATVTARGIERLARENAR